MKYYFYSFLLLFSLPAFATLNSDLFLTVGTDLECKTHYSLENDSKTTLSLEQTKKTDCQPPSDTQPLSASLTGANYLLINQRDETVKKLKQLRDRFARKTPEYEIPNRGSVPTLSLLGFILPDYDATKESEYIEKVIEDETKVVEVETEDTLYRLVFKPYPAPEKIRDKFLETIVLDKETRNKLLVSKLRRNEFLTSINIQAKTKAWTSLYLSTQAKRDRMTQISKIKEISSIREKLARDYIMFAFGGQTLNDIIGSRLHQATQFSIATFANYTQQDKEKGIDADMESPDE